MRNHTQTMLALYDLMLLFGALGGVFPEGITPQAALGIKSDAEGAALAHSILNSNLWNSLGVQLTEKKLAEILKVCVINREEYYSREPSFKVEALCAELEEIIADFEKLLEAKNKQ